MSDFSYVFGIDLGTTFSAISYIDEHGKPVVIPSQENRPITPSVVYFSDDMKFLVGDEAVNMLKADPQNTVSFIKRQMGRPNFNYKIHDRAYNPQEISAIILKKLALDAKLYFLQLGLEVEVKDVVITVPAYFGMDQRGATKEAGELAGLNVLMVMNEPTAAALAYGINKIGKDQNVFVFDLGGGTFDVTILSIKDNNIWMVASDGDPELGGKDWDDDLLSYCAESFKNKYHSDPQDDPYSFQELYDRVLKAKISLSKMAKTNIVVSHDGKRETIEVQRKQFESLTKDRLQQCSRLCKNVLEKANMSWSDLDTILLVGGSTYMPMVREMVRELSGKEPSTDVNPDQCVAIGAAYQAKYRFIEEEFAKAKELHGEVAAVSLKTKLLAGLKDIKIQECVAKSLGVILLDNNFAEYVHEMISEQTDIPHIVKDTFHYAYDQQTSVKVEITEGFGKKRDDVALIGEVILDKLPPRPKGTPLEVLYKYNINKTLDVEIVDVETGIRTQGQVTLGGSMSKEEKKASQDHISMMEQG
ncbi:Hsp70 family protein [Desulfovibrio sp. TomC]|uniref:Hsp70 family protein n=1 Tax=Desulfovibrio sp. TomC TaxID=1562888 RepID=UPI000573E8FE|nr:Hsp70 family protein [Desulfovibrio sp. TomC]KHK00220.1 Chaperone protein DnaK [Desulfovibrio sp. TomC]